ncbi:TrbI/VirB10 family protein [Providencia sp. CRE-3FA-0001]|uniref:IncF plasmid conjugative transfer pilus assembly protein TraB n=5 Tax=Enterobacterales TaxID=91347 RepID=A0A7L8KAA4_ECOLX|nr:MULTISPECIES: TrbI/VirB10 family protein [Enterobacterales]ELB1214853.1 conjugal transfer protein TrbI [Proteus mirabilis]ELY4881495.1 conjugal transfer protein TrbI [Morganella morganii]SPY66580.1 conjugal transfer pilus assembly protein TraB [Providencia stuartii]SUC33731.1 conjugal transfer pilus assembly protein TraB [Providencia rustigianii]ELR5094294.1 conjugal transfer protein TrbI [Providencia rettgeri]
MEKLKDLWANLDAKKKRYALWAGLAIVIIPLLLVIMPENSSPRSKATKEKVIQNVLTDSDTTGVSQNAIAARLRSLDETIKSTKTAVDTLNKTLDPDALNKRLTNIENVQKNEAAARQTLNNRIDTLIKNPPASSTGGALNPKNVFAAPQDGQSGEAAENQPQNARATASGTLQSVYENDIAPDPSDFDHSADASKSKNEAPASVPNIVTVQQDIKEEHDSDEDTGPETYLPATSIISGVFISGMDAPTAQNARNDPYPALIRIKKDAILPNRFRVDIRECGMLAAGFGDLSSERAYFRSEVITCIREDGAVFEASIDAYAVGEDGKAGVRGRLVTKQGQYLAKALTAGFLQAASQLFSVQSIPTINVNRDGNSRGGSPYEQVMSSQAMQGAAISGVGGALNRLADFYMKMATDLFPVIEIDPARSVDFVVQKGVSLKFNKVTSVGGNK